VAPLDPKGYLNSNIYIKLLNNQIDPIAVSKHIAKAGPEGTKFLADLLTTRCANLQSVLFAMSDIAMEYEQAKKSEMLFQCILQVSGAKYGTIYTFNQGSHKLVVKHSNLPEKIGTIPSDSLFGSKDVLKGDSVNSYNIRNSEMFHETLAGYYSEVSATCVFSAPLFGDEMRVKGVIELINKKDGNPYFTAEDEFMMRVLSSFGSMLKDHSVDEPSRDTHIKEFINTVSHIKSDDGITDVLEIIMNTARDIVSAERCTLFLIDHNTDELWSKLADCTIDEIRFPKTVGIAGHVACTGESLNIPDGIYALI
jgi:adenylate cyclase